MTHQPLSAGDKRLLRLAYRDCDAEGWTKVSEPLWPLVAKLPDALVEKERHETGGRLRLTKVGKAIAIYA